MSAILPDATIGILGGGQLGRMTAMAARSMGYRVHVLDPNPSCASAPVVDELVCAEFDDVAAIEKFARACDVVTLEIEKVSTEGLRRAALHTKVRPGAAVLEIIQDKGRQKSWLAANGFPVGPFALVSNEADANAALDRFSHRAFVKRCQGGYDGRGQVTVQSVDEGRASFAALGRAPCVVEQALKLEAELSVLVARRPSGEIAAYPPALNHHEDRILDTSVLPGPFPEATVREAVALGRRLADKLQLEGILVVELFLLEGGTLVVNELAPRPHNSFHATQVACAISQFELLVRAACDLPLGTLEVLRPVAIANLLGDLWLGRAHVPFDEALEVPGTRIHLYGKGDPRPGRKMGHLSSVGVTAEEAVARVKQARARLEAGAVKRG